MAVNEYLERELVAYYRRQRRRHLVFMAVFGAGLVATLAWLVLAKPEDGFWSAPVAAIGMPSTVGVIVIGLILATTRPVLLELLRSGVQVTGVRRGVSVIGRRPDRSSVLDTHVPAIFVQLADGPRRSCSRLAIRSS